MLVSLCDTGQVLLVLCRPTFQPWQRLAAPQQGSSRSAVVISESWEAAFWSEPCGAFHQGRRGCGGYHKQTGVGWAERVVVVEATDRPLPVGDPLSLKLSPQVKKCPPSVLGQVTFAPVLEAVEVSHCHRPGEVNQGGEDVLRIPIPRHHESRRPEVAALDPERTAAGGECELLNRADVHVEDPQLLLLLRRDENQVGGCDVEAPHLDLFNIEIIVQSLVNCMFRFDHYCLPLNFWCLYCPASGHSPLWELLCAPSRKKSSLQIFKFNNFWGFKSGPSQNSTITHLEPVSQLVYIYYIEYIDPAYIATIYHNIYWYTCKDISSI